MSNIRIAGRIWPASSINVARDHVTDKEESCFLELLDLIGHTNLTHAYVMEKILPPDFNCGQSLSVQHILQNCEWFKTVRKKYHLQAQLKELLGGYLEIIDKLISFIIEIGQKIKWFRVFFLSYFFRNFIIV